MEAIGTGLKYELVPCTWLTDEEITDYCDEFERFGEEVNVLWKIGKISPTAWKAEIANQERELYGAFLVDDRLAGVCRVTKEPRHAANGKMGYNIRPSQRGKGYSQIFLKLVEEIGRRYGVENMTACVDERNERSIRAFEKAGWKRTGTVYDWNPNPHPRKAIEFAP